MCYCVAHQSVTACATLAARTADVCEPARRGVRHCVAQLVPIVAGLLLKGVVSPGDSPVCYAPIERWWLQVIS